MDKQVDLKAGKGVDWNWDRENLIQVGKGGPGCDGAERLI